MEFKPYLSFQFGNLSGRIKTDVSNEITLPRHILSSDTICLLNRLYNDLQNLFRY